MTACEAELCVNWTGSGCICEAMDLEPDRFCEVSFGPSSQCFHCRETAEQDKEAEEVE